MPSLKPEALVEREVLLAVGRMPDVLLLRNEVGTGCPSIVGPLLRKALAPWGAEAVAAAMAVLNANRLTFGLGVGSPDLVGSVGGRAIGLELKAVDGEVSEEQRRWHAAAHRRGVFAAVVRSREEAVVALQRAREGAVE